MTSETALKGWWSSLTPEKRKVVMGVGCLGLLLGVLYLFVSAGPKKELGKGPEAKADVNLLTGSDTRTLGLDALGAELRSAQRSQRELQGKLEKLQSEGSTKQDVDRMSGEIAALKEALGTVKEDNGKRAVELETLRQKATSRSADGGFSDSDARLVEPQQGMDSTRRTQFDQASKSTNTNRGDHSNGNSREVDDSGPLKVRVYGEQEPQASNQTSAQKGDLYIPAGSLISGVLLTGVDAPTGMQSKRDPIPALMRIKHEAILPNRFRSDVRECFVVFGATGDLSTERALMRAETLSCIRQDGGVIEATIDAYAMGDDGKAGVRGRLVSRNGSLVAKAAFASFAEALSQVFRPVAIQGFNTTPGQRTQFQSPDTSEALEAAGYAGFGGAMKRLSEYFVDLADEIVPFVEVDAARQVDAVLLKGVTLKIRSNPV